MKEAYLKYANFQQTFFIMKYWEKMYEWLFIRSWNSDPAFEVDSELVYINPDPQPELTVTKPYSKQI